MDLLVPPESDPESDPEGGDGDGGDGKKNNEQGNASSDSGEAFRREMAQLPFRNFVHEQQFYSWQFRSARLYGRGAAGDVVKEEGGESGDPGGEAAGVK